MPSNVPNKRYIGISENKFKLRDANHIMSLKSEKYKKEIELSKEFWGIKDANKQQLASWEKK